MLQHYQLYINGEWTNPTSGHFFDVISPATGEVVSKAALGDEQDTLNAVEASNKAFAKWSQLPGTERAALLSRIYQLMLDNQEDLARTVSLEMGKPLKQSMGEVQNAADYVLWNAEEAKRTYGVTIPAATKNRRLQVIRQPVGPVGAITPWNFPLAMVTRKVAPALAAGCTVVLKPAEQTPGSAVQFFKLAEQAGIPKGVINLVTGDPEKIGRILLSDKRMRKITFTGSTAIGKHLLKQAAEQVKRVSMELGGHAPLIVFEEADLEQAVTSVLRAKFLNSGQTCVCPNRIYVQNSIKKSFLALLKEKVKALNVGNGLDHRVDVGPLINEEGLAKVTKHVEDAVSKGATVVTGGSVCEGEAYETGYYYSPTVLSGIDETMLISHEETFGPVAAIYGFDTEAEVIEKANDTDYGLAAYIFTKDLSRSVRVSEALEYGMVGINDTVLAQVQGPFGGIKESGIGREGGPEGLADFLETKFISTVI